MNIDGARLSDNEKAVLRAWRDGAANNAEVLQSTGLTRNEVTSIYHRFSKDFGVAFGDGRMVKLANALTQAGLI